MPYSKERISELARLALSLNGKPLTVKPTFTVEVEELHHGVGMGDSYQLTWAANDNLGKFKKAYSLPKNFQVLFTVKPLGIETVRDTVVGTRVGDNPAVDYSKLTAYRNKILAGPKPTISEVWVIFPIGDDVYIRVNYDVIDGVFKYRNFTQFVRDGRSVLQKIVPFAAIALGFTGLLGPMLSAIGNAVLPASVTAAYPALAGAVGNVAVTTALNGGDVAAAVKNQLLNVASAGVGQATRLVADYDAVARAAAAATRAALAGGDIKNAVGFSLLESATLAKPVTTAVDSTQVSNPGKSMDFSLTSTGGTGLSLPTSGSGLLGPQSAGGWWGSDAPSLIPASTDSNWLTGINSISSGSGSLLPASLQLPSAGGTDISSDWFNTAAKITTVAANALALVKAYKGQPLIAQGQSTSQGVARANPDGTVTFTNASGSRTGIPPVGQPYAIGDGRVIVNNGDGTYTLIGANGARQVLRYPATVGSVGNIPPVGGIGSTLAANAAPLLIAAAAGLALFAFTRKRQ